MRVCGETLVQMVFKRSTVPRAWSIVYSMKEKQVKNTIINNANATALPLLTSFLITR